MVNGLVPSFYEGELTGTVRLFGREVDDIPSWERGLAAGNVFQDPRSQFFANEVAGEIAFGCENYGLDKFNCDLGLKLYLSSFRIEFFIKSKANFSSALLDRKSVV